MTNTKATAAIERGTSLDLQFQRDPVHHVGLARHEGQEARSSRPQPKARNGERQLEMAWGM